MLKSAFKKLFTGQIQAEEEYKEILKKYGAWTAHNLDLGNGLFTIKPSPPDRASLRSIIYKDIIELFLRKKISGLKILDLGCLEGSISINLCRLGASCTGIDVRDAHLRKAEFAARALGLHKRCSWIKGDITDHQLWASLSKYDVIICSGILYHMEAKAIVPLMKNMLKKLNPNGLLIVDTNISSNALESVKISDKLTIWGRSWLEHSDSASEEERLSASWSSYKNNVAFWMTERSLTNALAYSGFSGVFRALMPFHEWGHQTRDIWIAVPGDIHHRQNLILRADPDVRPLNHPGIQ